MIISGELELAEGSCHCFLAEQPCFSKAVTVASGGGAVLCCGVGVWKSFPHSLHRRATISPPLK